MADHTLDIDLRRHYIAQAAAKRPKLPGNLKQLGAVGPVTRPLPANSQQAIVKVGVTKASTTGAHLAYLQHGKGPGGDQAVLFGPQARQARQFVQAAQRDPHQFRLIVSTPDHARLDRSQFIGLFMAQVLRDFGCDVEWVAAHHADTAHPHTHIVLRGRTTEGKDLYMEKHYFTQGLRDRASQLLTWFLGPRHIQAQQAQQSRTERQVFNGITRGIDDPDNRTRQERLTTLTQPRLMREPPRTQTLQTSQPQASGETLSARVEALRHALQQQTQDRQQGQGRGRSW